MRLRGRSLGISPIREWLRQSNKGQAIIIIALIFVGLIALVGLVVDVGTILARRSQLRRAVDAAGVQASNQYRESRELYNESGGGDIFSSVQQVMAAQGFYSPTARVRVYACADPASPPSGTNIIDDRRNSSPHVSRDQPDTSQFNGELASELCFDPPRKLVRVDAETDVGLPFLSIIGWKELVLHEQSVGEAAAIDFVLVLDRSRSMASETCSPSNNYGGFGSKPACVSACSTNNNCHPFEDVRSNAQLLIDRLKFPQDRVAVVQFDRYAWVYDASASTFITIPNTIAATVMISDQQRARDVLATDFSMQVVGDSIQGMVPFRSDGLNTNIGGGIRLATQILAIQGRRRNAVWMVLLLTDGAPNATDSTTDFIAGFCPPMAWPRPGYPGFTGTITVAGYYQHQGSWPFAEPSCLIARDPLAVPLSRTCILTDTREAKCAVGATIKQSTDSEYIYKYDPDDYARDQADYMANNGIVAFVIGLGPSVTEAPNYLDNINIPTNPVRDPDSGERLLRYVADMGYDPDVKFEKKIWPCQSNWAWDTTKSPLPTSTSTTPQNCGNYWYAATGSQLRRVFEEIAGRLFTRLAK